MLLLDAVRSLPEPQREVVFLRFYEGLAPREIAARLGVANPTVRSRLSRAVEELRVQLDSRTPGGRERWLASMLPLIASPVAGRSQAAGLLSTKSMLAGGLAVVSLVLGGWMLRSLGDASAVTGPALGGAEPAALGASAALSAAGLVEPEAGAARVAAGPDASEAPQDPGPRLLVRASWSDGEAAVGASIRILQQDESAGTRHLYDEAVNDAGMAVFSTLRPGDAWLTSDRGNQMTPVRVPTEGEATVEYVFDSGVRVSGSVVDPSGSPVPGAEVWLGSLSDLDWSAVLAGTCSDSGEFSLRSCGPSSQVFAAAPGFAPSLAISTSMMDGAATGTATGEFVLRESGFDLQGQVLDPSGDPVVGTTVWVEPVQPAAAGGAPWANPPAMRITTDEDGRYCLRTGLPGFDVQVQVLALGYPGWQARRSPPEGATLTVDVQLESGCSLHGVVRGPEGEPVQDALVSLERSPRRTWSRWKLAEPMTRTDADGKYRLAALPAGKHEVRALTRGARHFESAVSVELRPALEAEVDFELSPGRSIAGSVVDPSGEPLAGVWLTARPESFYHSSPMRTACTDERGEFSLDSLGLDPYSIEVLAVRDLFNVLASARNQRVGREDLQLVVDPAAVADAFVTGGPGAAVLESGSAWGFSLNHPGSPRPLMADTDAKAGTFRCGPVLPGTYVGELWSNQRLLLRLDAIVIEAGQVLDLGQLEVPARASLTLQFPDEVREQTHLQLEHENGRAIEVLKMEGAIARAVDLLPGRYVIRGEWPSRRLSTWQFTLSPGEDRVEAIDLVPSHSVAVRFEGRPDPGGKHPLELVDEGGRVVEKLTVRLIMDSRAETAYCIYLLNLAAGSYSVRRAGEPVLELGSFAVSGRVPLEDPILVVLPD